MSIVKILPDVAKEKMVGVRPLVVGVKDVPIMRKWKGVDVLTRQSAYVKLDDERGIHASRLMKVLMEYEKEELEFTVFEHYRETIGFIAKLESSHGTDVAFKCKWESMEEGLLIRRIVEYSDVWYMTMEIPYVSICPCAKQLTVDAGKGFPHQQRSMMKVTILWEEGKDVLPELVNLFLMPEEIMKREQELDWCVRADTPVFHVFVEDAARRIGKKLEEVGINEFLIECEHFESLHQHQMIAVNRSGRFI